jgi:hypothetical protein
MRCRRSVRGSGSLNGKNAVWPLSIVITGLNSVIHMANPGRHGRRSNPRSHVDGRVKRSHDAKRIALPGAYGAF